MNLGRLYIPDERDKKFKLKSIIAEPSTRTSRNWWANGWWGNQGMTSQCVAYSWTHWVHDGPVSPKTKIKPIIDPSIVYSEAQKN